MEWREGRKIERHAQPKTATSGPPRPEVLGTSSHVGRDPDGVSFGCLGPCSLNGRLCALMFIFLCSFFFVNERNSYISGINTCLLKKKNQDGGCVPQWYSICPGCKCWISSLALLPAKKIQIEGKKECSLYFIPLVWGCWGLNSGPHDCHLSTVPLEPLMELYHMQIACSLLYNSVIVLEDFCVSEHANLSRFVFLTA